MTKLIKRVDRQGAWEDREQTFDEWYEYVISTLWSEDHITSKEYDEKEKVTDDKIKFEDIEYYAEVWQFDFLDENNVSIFS